MQALRGRAGSASAAPAATRPLLPHRQRVRARAFDLLKPITSSGQIADLNEGIAALYDESTGLWEDMWGEHLHHGYYPAGGPPKSNQQAQVDMVDAVLDWAGVASVDAVLDVGCGVGGSSRHIARRYGCSASGITLSPYQAGRANELSRQAGLGEACSFQVADALAQPFADGSFDLVWSLESGEHMPDKARFVAELARVAAPGGRVIVVTWCHRVLGEGEALRPEEAALLERICEAYYLPAWCSVADYERLFEANGLRDINTADWSEAVAPFWGEVIKSAMTSRGVLGLLKAGWTTIKGALVMPLMVQGFRMGLIKFVLLTGTKPAA